MPREPLAIRRLPNSSIELYQSVEDDDVIHQVSDIGLFAKQRNGRIRESAKWLVYSPAFGPAWFKFAAFHELVLPGFVAEGGGAMGSVTCKFGSEA